MSRKHLGIVVLLAVGIAAGAGTLTARWLNRNAQSAPPPQAEKPALTVDPRHLDFGEVWLDSKELVIRLPLQNASARAVHVSEFQTGCNCRPVEPNALTLGPNETREIRLTLTDLNRPEHVGRSRSIQAELRPIVDGKPTTGWTISGVVRPRIESDCSAVLFGDSNRAGQPPVTRTINVRLHQPGTPNAKLLPEVADVHVRPGASATEWKISVTPHTDRKPGPFQAVMTVTNTSPGGVPVASLDLPVEGVLSEVDR